MHSSGLPIDRILQEVNSVDWEVSFWLEEEPLSVLSGIYREGGDDTDAIEFIRNAGFEDAETVFKGLMQVDTFRIMRFKGYEWVDYVVENALYNLAKGFYVTEWKEVLVEGEVVKLETMRYVQSSPQATFKWLENRKNERWKTSQTLANSESEGSAKSIKAEMETFNLTTSINKLRNINNKRDEYEEEEFKMYEKLYLGHHYDLLIDKVYSHYTVDELIKIALNGK